MGLLQCGISTQTTLLWVKSCALASRAMSPSAGYGHWSASIRWSSRPTLLSMTKPSAFSRRNVWIAASPTSKSSPTKSPHGRTTATSTTPKPTGNSQPPTPALL
jgi:hypothetical protein